MKTALALLEDFTGISAARLVSVALLGFAIVLVALIYHRSVYNRGWSDALTSVAAQNGNAAASAARVRIGVSQCYDQGGTWNVRIGACDLP